MAGAKASFENLRGIEMIDKTKAKYRKRAQHFYETVMRGAKATSPARIQKALLKVAGNYRPDSWRELRNALEFDQREKGFSDSADKIKETKNPITAGLNPSNKAQRKILKDKVKSKQKRAKKISNKDFTKLMDKINTKTESGKAVAAALFIARETGCRPVEMLDIDTLPGNKIKIWGAKKIEAGNRGLDRIMELEPETARHLHNAIQYLREYDEKNESGTDSMKKIQNNLRSAARRASPKKQALPSLYTFRHQFGSNLKASGLSATQQSYLMGHQATASIEVYGNARSATAGGLNVKPGASESVINSLVRDTANKPAAYDKSLQQSRQQDHSRSTPGMGLSYDM